MFDCSIEYFTFKLLGQLRKRLKRNGYSITYIGANLWAETSGEFIVEGDSEYDALSNALEIVKMVKEKILKFSEDHPIYKVRETI
jgi:broad-specificity NMP kinase